jgi:iron complex transport system ATP-binding protein
MEVLELARRLCGDGLGVLLVTHHLNLAARYADRLLLLHRGAIAAQGTPVAVLRPEILSPVFEWPVAIATWDGIPQIVPLRPET